MNEILSENKNNEAEALKETNKTAKKKNMFIIEDTLIDIANTILILGVVGSVIYMFKFGFDAYYEIDIINMMISAIIFITSIICWAIMKVLANISNTLKEINEKMK